MFLKFVMKLSDSIYQLKLKLIFLIKRNIKTKMVFKNEMTKSQLELTNLKKIGTLIINPG